MVIVMAMVVKVVIQEVMEKNVARLVGKMNMGFQNVQQFVIENKKVRL